LDTEESFAGTVCLLVIPRVKTIICSGLGPVWGRIFFGSQDFNHQVAAIRSLLKFSATALV
jgi:hypothetical protein